MNDWFMHCEIYIILNYGNTGIFVAKKIYYFFLIGTRDINQYLKPPYCSSYKFTIEKNDKTYILCESDVIDLKCNGYAKSVTICIYHVSKSQRTFLAQWCLTDLDLPQISYPSLLGGNKWKKKWKKSIYLYATPVELFISIG